jgi:hypothetical protein
MQFSSGALSALAGACIGVQTEGEIPCVKNRKSEGQAGQVAGLGFVLIGGPRRLVRHSPRGRGLITTHFECGGFSVVTYSEQMMRGRVFLIADTHNCENLSPEAALALSYELWAAGCEDEFARALWSAALCEDCQ